MIRKLLMPVARWLIVERPARGKSIAILQREMESAAEGVAENISNGADTPENRAQAGHIIGIEGWAQQRLRVALGEPQRDEEYDGYRPEPELDMLALRDRFLDVRHNSLVLASELQDEGVTPQQTVEHNDFGPVSVGGWLQYITGHASFEAKRIKAAEPASE